MAISEIAEKPAGTGATGDREIQAAISKEGQGTETVGSIGATAVLGSITLPSRRADCRLVPSTIHRRHGKRPGHLQTNHSAPSTSPLVLVIFSGKFEDLTTPVLPQPHLTPQYWF